MRYDKNGLPIKEYYTEEIKKSPQDKMKALKFQKYYTGGAIILMFLYRDSQLLVDYFFDDFELPREKFLLQLAFFLHSLK